MPAAWELRAASPRRLPLRPGCMLASRLLFLLSTPRGELHGLQGASGCTRAPACLRPRCRAALRAPALLEGLQDWQLASWLAARTALWEEGLSCRQA
jgi:hypothetical protein